MDTNLDTRLYTNVCQSEPENQAGVVQRVRTTNRYNVQRLEAGEPLAAGHKMD